MATQSSNKEVSFLANSGMGNLKTSFLPPLKLLVLRLFDHSHVYFSSVVA